MISAKTLMHIVIRSYLPVAANEEFQENSSDYFSFEWNLQKYMTCLWLSNGGDNVALQERQISNVQYVTRPLYLKHSHFL